MAYIDYTWTLVDLSQEQGVALVKYSAPNRLDIHRHIYVGGMTEEQVIETFELQAPIAQWTVSGDWEMPNIEVGVPVPKEYNPPDTPTPGAKVRGHLGRFYQDRMVREESGVMVVIDGVDYQVDSSMRGRSEFAREIEGGQGGASADIRVFESTPNSPDGPGNPVFISMTLKDLNDVSAAIRDHLKACKEVEKICYTKVRDFEAQGDIDAALAVDYTEEWLVYNYPSP